MKTFVQPLIAACLLFVMLGCNSAPESGPREGDVKLDPVQESQLQPGADGDKAVTQTESTDSPGN